MKILFVDDDPVRLTSLLKRLGNNVDVVYAKNCAEAKKYLQSTDFNVISLDHDLGETHDGYDLAKFIVQNELQVDAQFLVHSMNPIGCRNIYEVLTGADYMVSYTPGLWSKIRYDDITNKLFVG